MISHKKFDVYIILFYLYEVHSEGIRVRDSLAACLLVRAMLFMFISL